MGTQAVHFGVLSGFSDWHPPPSGDVVWERVPEDRGTPSLLYTYVARNVG